ncbi:hypothetical protein DRJ58_04800 [Candidatus Acetothermia bacterium]|nr:MAG: hypothetical protein DRJ58_04800 [Candidatus Acetothermia bacterium]
MTVIYDPHTDTLTLILKESPVVERDEAKPGMILDYDAEGDLVSIEVLAASKQVTEPQGIEFQMVKR